MYLDYMCGIIYKLFLLKLILVKATSLQRRIKIPYMKDGKRDYKREYQKYHSKPEQIKNRAERNSARSELAKEGLVHKGDGKDVDHKKPLNKGGSNSRSNLRAVPKSTNRSFSRNSNGSVKSQTSKREKK